MKPITILKLISFSISLFLIACNANKKTPAIDNTFNLKNPGYEKLWKQVEQHDKDGLPKSGLEVVETILATAKKDNNAPQKVKALIYKAKYAEELNQDGMIASINMMRTELDEASGVERAIFASLLADYYNLYYNNERWRIQGRSEVVDFVLTDVKTWSEPDFRRIIRDYYLASLEEEVAKSAPLSAFTPALKSGENSSSLMSTVYDLLAHRALNYFSGQSRGFSDNYNIDQPAYISGLNEFVNIKLEIDTSSNKYYALKIMQDRLQFLKEKNEVPALVVADLERLEYVYLNGKIANKKELYLEALNELADEYASNPVTAEVMHKIALFYAQEGNLYKREDENEKRGDYFVKARAICNNAISKYPKSFGASGCRKLKYDLEFKKYDANVQRENLPNQPFLFQLSYKNCNKVFVEVYKYEIKPGIEPDYINHKDGIKKLKSYQKVWEKSFSLTGSEDLRVHHTELKIDALPIGTYYIVAREKSDIDAKEQSFIVASTNITNIAYYKPEGHYSGQMVVVDRTTGAPIENAVVDYYDTNRNERNQQLRKFDTQRTNVDGIATLQEASRNYKVSIKYGDDVLHSNQYMYQNNYRDRNRERQNTHFFTDRAIYRPGQKLYFKGILTKTSTLRMPSILTNQKVTVRLMDANYQEVSKLELTSNEFGSVSGEFDLPSGGLTGRMSLSSSIGGSSISFRVEEYKRPKFKVEFEEIEKDFALNDQVTIDGTAITFAGSGVDNSDVRYRVMRQQYFPYLPWFMRRYYPSAGGQEEIINGMTKTDANGKFTIEFPAKPATDFDKDLKPVYRYQVMADVIDVSGETRSGTINISVGTVGILADLKIPNQVNIDSLVEVGISTKTLNGVALDANVDVYVAQLDQPNKVFLDRLWQLDIDEPILTKADYEKYFPEFAYQNEDDYNTWKEKKIVLERKNINTKDIKTIPLDQKNWEPGRYIIYLKTKDKNGTEVEVKKHFKVYDLNNEAPNGTKVFEVMQEQMVYNDPGNHDIYLKSNKDKLYAFFQLTHKNKLVEQEWIPVDLLKKKTIGITEKYRGDVSYLIAVVKDNRIYHNKYTVSMPWVNKELTIEYETFRDKLLPGQEEEWRIKISGYKKDKVAAEMVATLYDASLDEFTTANWMLSLWPTFYSQSRIQNISFELNHSEQLLFIIQRDIKVNYRTYPDFIRWREITRFGGHGRAHYGVRTKRSKSLDEVMVQSSPIASASMREEQLESELVLADAAPAGGMVDADDGGGGNVNPPSAKEKKPEFSPRKNLNETVFFFPDMKTNANGDIILKFTMNEALTNWKFKGLAHTKGLKVGTTENEVVTQKDLMIFPNAPRFMREGDGIRFAGKVSNMTDKPLSGTAMLELFDATTEASINQQLGNTQFEIPFTIPAGQSAPLMWNLKIPIGLTSAVTYRMKASSTNGSVTVTDGEESSLPIVTNRMLVTESLPLWVRANQTKDFTMQSLLQSNNSSTLQHHNLSLEFTSNPAWYAVQALPYLSEYPHNCTEQIFNRYYANAIAANIANSNPKIKKVFDKWRDENPEALLSNLSKNQELKSALLEETPWVLDAQNEEEQKKNIAILFDTNRMAREEQKAMAQIRERQKANNGGFSWFPGGRPSWYITQYIVEGCGHLEKLGAQGASDYMQVVEPAVGFMDRELMKHYKDLKKRKGVNMDDDHLSSIVIHYLYARSFFPQIEMSGETRKIADYYKGQAEKYWLSKNLYHQGMLALALNRDGEMDFSNKIISSLKEKAIQNEELGMFWKYDRGYFWHQLPIETHTLLIEAFEEIDNDKALVDEMRIWLLKNKQTNHWKTTKGTAAAIYALLIRGNDWLGESKPVAVKLADQEVDLKELDLQAGTGYFKTNYEASAINAEMSKVTVENKNDVMAWGGMYWQYFEDLDNIKTFEETPLMIKKKLFKEVLTDNGPVIQPVEAGETLTVGDKIKVRIELRVDRDMEYIHMKDMRASGFEPIHVLSQYKWQDGLGYYESTKDLATHFFMDYLPRGTYVFEYPLRVFHKGEFSNGITSVQCMYAPEFSSHSEGERVLVE